MLAFFQYWYLLVYWEGQRELKLSIKSSYYSLYGPFLNVVYLIDPLKFFLFVTSLLVLKCDLNIFTDMVFYLVMGYAILLKVQIMLKPSVLIEMQITHNYQPANCSNTMNYWGMYFHPGSPSTFSCVLFCMWFSCSCNLLNAVMLPGFDRSCGSCGPSGCLWCSVPASGATWALLAHAAGDHLVMLLAWLGLWRVRCVLAQVGPGRMSSGATTTFSVAGCMSMRPAPRSWGWQGSGHIFVLIF